MAPIPELEDDGSLHDSERDVSMKETPAPTRKKNQSHKRKSTDDEAVEDAKKRKSNPTEEEQTILEEETFRTDTPFQSPDVRRKSTGLRTKPQQLNQQVFVNRKHKSVPSNVLDANTSYQTPKKTNIEAEVPPSISTFIPEKQFAISRNKASKTGTYTILASLVAIISIVYLIYVQYVTLDIPKTNVTEESNLSNNTQNSAPIIKYFYVTNNVTSNVNHSEIFEKLIEKHSKQFKNNMLDLIDTRLYELERKLNNNIRSSISSSSVSVKKEQQKELEKLKESLLSKISTEVDIILSQKLKSINDINEQSISEIKGRLDTIIPGVKNLIDESLDKYDADKIGLTDYALSSLGSKIVEHSPTYSPSKFWPQLFVPVKTPDMIIKPDTTIGNCWPMKGSSGFVVIEIAHSIIPTSFSIDHVPKALSPNISSAPKQISVFGYENETTLTKLSAFEYDVHGSPTQTFPVNESTNKKYNKFRFQISGNYGNSFYTCIYRFRIHGDSQAMIDKTFADGLIRVLEPLTTEYDSKVKDIQISQTKLAEEIDRLAKKLDSCKEEAQFVNVAPYLQKLANSRKRVINISTTLGHISDRLSRLNKLAKQKYPELEQLRQQRERLKQQGSSGKLVVQQQSSSSSEVVPATSTTTPSSTTEQQSSSTTTPTEQTPPEQSSTTLSNEDETTKSTPSTSEEAQDTNTNITTSSATTENPVEAVDQQ
ncbi:predicted protein [Naegleria gruberi]|uniref:Predicted protein n=1 Tax=Naegleria gruberi TaxID=5762 RepID=D2VL48_NAEGR|nr:uncharacterized protein NAEGRDRAFT_69660 [Naegleria gruberi]EFC42478.1 predicted protein [Naegleria gruberi]|eukprot:XP_002675222.1 predicted protein [Naegleria gruberi strain NEG-M]